jgi:hypothetical protein
MGFVKAAGFLLVAAAGAILLLRLASLDLALAWAALLVFGVSVIGGIVFLAYRTLRNPWTALNLPEAKLPSDNDASPRRRSHA